MVLYDILIDMYTNNVKNLQENVDRATNVRINLNHYFFH